MVGLIGGGPWMLYRPTKPTTESSTYPQNTPPPKQTQEYSNWDVKVLGQAECEARKMGAYLAVAQGSKDGPEFIHLSYKPKGGK